VFDLVLQHNAPVRGSKGRRAVLGASAKRGQIATLERDRLTRTDILRALNSFRREIKGPRQDHCDWKTNYEQQHYQTHRPIWNFEKRKDLASDLHQQPSHDSVGDSNFVNVALL
jgi:hypothetical protein